jgi:hypothetical protein
VDDRLKSQLKNLWQQKSQRQLAAEPKRLKQVIVMASATVNESNISKMQPQILRLPKNRNDEEEQRSQQQQKAQKAQNQTL